jgi:hypothetical protein
VAVECLRSTFWFEVTSKEILTDYLARGKLYAYLSGKYITYIIGEEGNSSAP